jgi:2-oxoglutarate ferredoxin oxidoreductase subunit alpha
MPKNTEEVLKSFKNILIPELNMGQLSKLIRGEYMIDTIQLNKIQGQPFKTREILNKIEELLK